MNIDRQSGFPLCAEMLKVLDENSRMLEAMLREITLDRRHAAEFGQYMLVCDQNGQKRVVKKGAESATSRDQCKLMFSITNKDVEDSNGNTFQDVWVEERANIMDENDPNEQWTILSIQEVLREVWRDLLPVFEAGLLGTGAVNGTVLSITLNREPNVLRSSTERVKIRIGLSCTVRVTENTVLTIPFPCECPDGTRVETDIEHNGYHYPARAYIGSGMLHINIGRWLKDEDLFTPSLPLPNMLCNIIIRINKEVVL